MDIVDIIAVAVGVGATAMCVWSFFVLVFSYFCSIVMRELFVQ